MKRLSFFLSHSLLSLAILLCLIFMKIFVSTDFPTERTVTIFRKPSGMYFVRSAEEIHLLQNTGAPSCDLLPERLHVGTAEVGDPACEVKLDLSINMYRCTLGSRCLKVESAKATTKLVTRR